jgi:hypothetical protein
MSAVRRVLSCAVAIVLAAGCARQEPAALAGRFATPEAGVEAFVKALRENDREKLRDILGPESDALLESGDEVQSARERRTFLHAFDQKHDLVSSGADAMTLEVGFERWPLPIPIVKRDDGWQFDAAGGADELVLRRIGRNELAAIDVCHGVVAAQLEYAAKNGGYAAKVISDPGKRNGLYWETRQGEATSPAGPLLALATAEGYELGRKPTPYHGYFYRSLPAGARDAEGKGFAFVAYPADYGASGVMTFLVNQDGVVYQSDLGEETEARARALAGFSVEGAWSPAET